MSKLDKKNIEAIYPLSPMQDGMLFHTLLNKEKEEYIQQVSTTINGKLNVDAFKNAWQKTIDRNTSLRTSFVYKKVKNMLQVVHKKVKLPFEYLDWSTLAEDQIEKQIEDLLVNDRKKGFNLTKPPAMRILLIRLTEDKHKLIWTHHHIILDGWSLPLLLKEVFTFYEAFNSGTEINLPFPQPYKNYITWLKNKDLKKAKEFWTEYLKGFSTPVEIKLAKEEKTIEGIESKTIAEEFSELETEKIKNIAQENKITINTIIQIAWANLIHKYTGENDIVFGATTSGRPTDLYDAENIIGLFINTLPIRSKISNKTTIIQQLKQFHNNQGSIREFEYTPLVEIQKWSDMENKANLFNNIFVFENYPVDESINNPNLSFEISDVKFKERTNFPLTLIVAPGKKLSLKIYYDINKFDEVKIKRMVNHLKNITIFIINNLDKKVTDIKYLSDEEIQKLFVEFNNTSKKIDYSKPIHKIISEVAEKKPDNIALIFNDQKITYVQLENKSNQLANYLIKKGVSVDSLVGILIDRSFEMLYGLLAILKAGGAYLPIKPNNPFERIKYKITDSKTKIVLTDSSNKHKLKDLDIKILVLDEIENLLRTESDKKPEVNINIENTMYCIYTSGSTGNPKGTLVPHKGVLNRLLWMKENYKISTEDVLIQKTPFAFDVSVWELFLALMSGARLVIAKPEGHKDSNYIKKLIKKEKVTTIHFVPAMLNIFLEEESLAEDCGSLKRVICSGEALSYELQNKFFKKIPLTELHNLYGPTEASIDVSYWECKKQSKSKKVPIGRPIWNTQLYVLDKNLNPMPIGIPGELYIGGVSLARGYLNREDLTAEKFIPDFINNNPGSRMYKTGDLVQVLEDGSIEYLNRIDNQVKIRGLRIELGEIETKLLESNNIKEAVVGVKEITKNDKTIVAYIVPVNKNKCNLAEFKKYLKERLPEYMIPNNFIVLDKIPVNPNGKVDRKKLASLKFQLNNNKSKVLKNNTPSEELLVSLCKEVLDLENVNLDDNFFDIGGHSLKAAQLVARVRSAFKVELPIKEVFETSTISELAYLIDKIKKQEDGFEIPPLVKRNEDETPQLSFSQKRLWFLDQLEPLKDTYNISAAIKLIGKLNYNALEKSLNTIVSRHEVLRTTFYSEDGKPYVKIHQHKNVELNIIDLSKSNDVEKESKKIVEQTSRTIFNLENGPLYKVLLIKLNNLEHVFVVVMHHIISDGWSIGIMVNELSEHYRSYLSDEEIKIYKLEIQYSDYASWMNNWLKDDVLDRKIKYWKEKLEGIPEVLELPLDHMRPPIQTFNGASINFSVEKNIVEKLSAVNKKEGLTNFMSLLTVFQILLSKYSRQDDIVIGSPIANRTHSKVENLIGFFVNTLIIRSQLNINNTIIDTLKQTRAITLEAFNNSDVPFEYIVDAVQPERSMSHSPLFQVAFVYQNNTDDFLKLKGLEIENYQFENTTAKYDITLYVKENKDKLLFTFEYNTDLFKKETINRLSNHFVKILEQVVSTPKMKLSNISLLLGNEYVELVKNINKTEVEFEKEKCIHNVFENIVNIQPDETAITYSEFEGETLYTNELSYNDLNIKANKLANYLAKNGITNESMVAVSTARSFDLIISVFAILKTGAAFLPIDPTYPEERIKYMLQDSGVSIVLTQSIFSGIYSKFNGKVIVLDDNFSQIENEPSNNLNIKTYPENLAYVIYTSGTTGKPKGTLLQHKGAVNLAQVQKKAFSVTSESKIFQFASLSFDAFVWETLMALLNGASLNLASQEIITSGEDLVKAFIGLGITTVTLPPSVLSIIPADYSQNENLRKLKTIIVAGEKCSSELTNKWAVNRRFINAYGPTETTVCASMFVCHPNCRISPPIGKAIDNFKLYILDRNLNPVPVGVPGELYISGVGLSRGYHNKPNLTAEKFIPNPFSEETGSRMYSTGDLVKYMHDGNIQFIGRIDSQIKLRGFRIEIGEIVSVLSRYPNINEVIVTVREDKPGIKQLVAYFTTNIEAKLDIAKLRAFIRKELPDYMVPSAYVTLEKFPLTLNKKIDYRALPKPSSGDKVNKTKFVKPRNEIEKNIAKIGEDLLGIDQMGIYDNFFELGGHSLLATQFISRIKESFNKEISLRALFEKPTIAELAEIIASSEIDKEEESIDIEERSEKSIEDLINEIDTLSDSEVEKLLKGSDGPTTGEKTFD